MNRKNSLYAFILIVVTIATFSPTFCNDFQYEWDDQWQVLEYEFVTNHSFNDLLYHFTHFHLNQYMPVNTVLYIIIYEMFGFNPFAFHSACLIIHLVNVLLVYIIIRKIITKVKPFWTEKRIILFSVITALVFAIHPLQVESVAWISASKIPLYSLFFLIGIWLYVSYLETNKMVKLFGVLICYLLSFGSKEQAVIFPLNLIIIDYLFSRYSHLKFSFYLVKERVVIEKIIFMIVAVLLCFFSLSNNHSISNQNVYPFYHRVLFASSSMMEYIFRSIAPVKLYYYYFFPMAPGDSIPFFYWLFPVLIIICGVFLWNNIKNNNKLIVFGALIFLINILLVLHIIPMPRKIITADRYMYFSLIGVGVILAWFTFYVYEKWAKWRKVTITILCVWFLAIGIHSFIRVTEWKNSDSIKSNVIKLIEKKKANEESIFNKSLSIN